MFQHFSPALFCVLERAVLWLDAVTISFSNQCAKAKALIVTINISPYASIFILDSLAFFNCL